MLSACKQVPLGNNDVYPNYHVDLLSAAGFATQAAVASACGLGAEQVGLLPIAANCC